jgi:hypothetical protein
VGSEDHCSIDLIVSSFERHDSVRELLLDVATADAVLYVAAAPAAADTDTDTDNTNAEPAAVAGVLTRIYDLDASLTALPDFATLTPASTYVGADFDISPRGAADEFAFVFEATLTIDAAGDHTFFVTSDDGSRLTIDGEVVVDNDGAHAVQERSGTIALTAGPHEIRVEYFEAAGRERLSVEWQPPAGVRAPVPTARLTTTARD